MTLCTGGGGGTKCLSSIYTYNIQYKTTFSRLRRYLPVIKKDTCIMNICLLSTAITFYFCTMQCSFLLSCWPCWSRNGSIFFLPGVNMLSPPSGKRSYQRIPVCLCLHFRSVGHTVICNRVHVYVHDSLVLKVFQKRHSGYSCYSNWITTVCGIWIWW